MKLVRGLICVVALAPAAAGAEPPALQPTDAFGAGSHETYLQRIGSAQGAEYATVLRAYDEHLQTHPGDAVAAVEKCRLIAQFAYAEVTPIESATADHEACEEQLRTGPSAGSAEAQLYLMEQQWGDEGISSAESLLQKASAWLAPQRARLHAHLALMYQSKDEAKAGMHAVKAIDLDPGASTRLMAARWLARTGAKVRARQLIASAPADWKNLSSHEAAQLLIELDDAAGAANLLQARGVEKDNIYQQLLLARALAASGDFTHARQIYTTALAGNGVDWALQGLRDYFNFECEHGSKEQAQSAYDRLRKQGYKSDPFGYYRMALTLRHPSTSWAWSDLPGLLALLGVLLLAALLPVLVLAPAHYRGLARKLGGKPAEPVPVPWELRHAWYGLAAFVFVGMLAAYTWDYPAFEAIFGWLTPLGVTSEPGNLAQVALWQTGLALLLVLPLLRGVNLLQLLKGNWSWGRSILVGIGCAFLARFAAVVMTGLTQVFAGGAAPNETTRALLGIHAEYGLAALLFTAGLAIPLLEEFLFRGVLLTAFRKQLSFAAAASLQALAFAAIHEELKMLPFFFLFGLLAARLYRSSGGLLAPIAMHATFNLMAAMAIAMYANMPVR